MESDEGRGGENATEIAPEEAAAALSAIGAGRSWLADRAIAPCWYHPALGLLAGAAIALAETRSWVVFGWSVAAYTVGCGAVMWLNQRRVGVALRYFDARTRVIFAANVLALAGLITIGCWLEFGRGLRGAFLVAGVLAVPLTVVFGRWTDKVLRSRLQAGG